MARALSTKRTDLPDSRVRVEVEVEPGAVEHALEHAAVALGKDLKAPGFRKGKVPPQVVMQRVGRPAMLEEALRHALPGWYEDAVAAAEIAPVGEPEVKLADLPEKGGPLGFSFDVGVRPDAELGDFEGIEVGRREPEVTQAEITEQLDQLREAMASLENVDREAQEGDFLALDFTGTLDGEPFEGGEARGFMLELGSGRLVEGFEGQLVGAKAGEQRRVEVTFPDDHASGGGEEGSGLAGKDVVFEVDVKEVKQKLLPELDDDLAADAGGFDTLDELRADVEEKISEAKQVAIEREFREAAVDAAAATSKIDLPDALVEAKAREMWNATVRALERRGVSAAQYTAMAGKSEDELIAEARDDADRALRREATLAAIVEREALGASDEEILDALREAAAAQGAGEVSDDELKASLEGAKEQGRDGALRQDIAMRKAVDLLAGHAAPIPLEQAEARDALWTPEKEGEQKKSKLWTPGS